MKIIYGITKSNFGGAQRYVFDLAVGAKNAGHEVAVLCGGNGPLVEKLKVEGIKVITIPDLGRDISILNDWKTFRFILKILKAEKPDIFHTNSSKMGGIGNLAGRIARIKKIIFTSHGWAFNENRNWLSKLIILKLVWYTIIFSHKTVCVSEKTKSQVSWMPFIKNKLVVVHNGIEKFELVPRTDNSFVVGTIAELHHIKGLDILLKAWAVFKKNNVGRLEIFGSGEERENLQNMAKNLGISDSVIFKGYVENARSYLLAFDIFVLPSRSENLPYAILEAGVASRAVIASNVGGIPEIIQNENCGILVEKENVSALSEALIKLANNQNFRETLGNNLHKVVTEQFSKEKMLRETLTLYK